ncbi:MAG: phage tail protein [Rhodobacteraceae bacterium]|nr:MAG: phage tail protein [Paracoccaceae bacterium]
MAPQGGSRVPNRPIRPTPAIPTRPHPATPIPQPTRPSVVDGPTLAVNFTVEAEGARFNVDRIEGLALAADASALRQGRDGTGAVTWSAPAATGRLLLRRAVDGDRTLYHWRREAAAGKPDARDLVIRQLDRSGTETLNAWRVVAAWPLAWRGPLFDALDGGIAFETLELVFADVVWL